MIEKSDTPLGVYDMPDTDMWIAGSQSGEKRKGYGANHRLILDGSSGEIEESGRSLIRIHGGRQETYDEETKTWSTDEDAQLKKTEGCLRTYDNEILQLKEITDQLLVDDPEEFGGTVTVTADLMKIGKKYYAPADAVQFGKAVAGKVKSFVFDLLGKTPSKEEFKQQLSNQASDAECDYETEAQDSDKGSD